MNTNTPNPPKQYSCAHLGVCKSRPGCNGRQHDTATLPPGGFYFAPGAIEEPSKPTRTDTLGRWLLTAAALAAIAAVIGMSAGWITVGGLL